MILTLSGRDEASYPRLFREMYLQRHGIFVERRRWRSLEWQPGLERDAYDTTTATYVVALGTGGTILAAARLLPSLGPHLLSDVFPHLVEGGVPRGHHVCEITRFYVAERSNPTARRRRISRLSSAIFAYCRGRGITTLTGVVDTFMLPIMDTHAWVFRRLGAAHPYDEGNAVAVAVAVEASHHAIAERKAGQENKYTAPQLLYDAKVAPSGCPS